MSRRSWALAVWLCSTGAAQVSMACDSMRRVSLGNGGELVLLPAERAAGLIWLEESGLQLSVEVGGSRLDIYGGPTRYGVLPVRIGSSETLKVHGRVDPLWLNVGIGCAEWGSAEDLRWWDALGTAVPALNATEPSSTDAFESLAQQATTPFQRAVARHYSAYRLATQQQRRAAASAYAGVADAWLALGLRARAGAASLGAADAAAAGGQFEQAIGYARQAESLLDQPDDVTFRIRSREVPCRVYENRDQLDEAAQCVLDTRAQYLAAGAVSDATNSLNSLIYIEEKRGNPAAALAAEQAVLSMDPALVYPLIRGRALMMRARRLEQGGEVVAAVAAYAQAMAAYGEIPEQGRGEEREALSKLARLYASIGMVEMAYRAVGRLLAESRAQEDPNEAASLLLTLSLVEEHAGRPQAALRWAQVSAALFRNMQDVDGELEALLREAELRLRHGLVADADVDLDALLRLGGQWSKPDQQRVQLLQLLQALQRGEQQRAEPLIQQIMAMPLDSAQRALVLAVRSRQLRQAGGAPAAFELLAGELRHSLEHSGPATNVGLSWMARRALAAQRTLLVDNWLAQPPESRLAGPFWAAWIESLPAGAIQARSEAPEDFAASAAVAREFTESQPASRTQMAVLKSLALDSGGQGQRAVPDLAALQASLWPGDVLLVLASGRDASVLFRISREQLRFEPLAGRAVLLQAALDLNSAIQERRNAAQIQAARQALQDLLWVGVAEPAPQRLLLLADDVLAHVPVAVLDWPGAAARPLIETTRMSWVSDVRIGTRDAMPQRAAVQEVDVLLASRAPAGKRVLPELSATAIEPELIARGFPAARLLRAEGAAANAAHALNSLRRPGGWFHLASHGWNEAGMLGHAGAWLYAAEGGEAQFLSWLDLADHPLQADLAVFNACQLAEVDRQAVSQGSMSFAVAVSAAGVRNTVAAFWPVSDAATGIWVPAFYGHLAGRDADASAEALRQAQLALRDSRSWRHPYYWASLGHFIRLDVSPPH